MDLDFTPEQEMLRETGAPACAQRHAGLDVVRQMEDDPIGYPDKFWQQLAELGLLGMTLPEEHGGSGHDDARRGGRLQGARSGAGAVAALRELGDERGRHRSRPGSDAQQRRVAAADLVAARRSSRPRGSSRAAASGPTACSCAADADGDGWRLTGTKRHVAFAPAADRLLVLARDRRRDPIAAPRRPAGRRASRSPSR